jgi:hypothetical protein
MMSVNPKVFPVAAIRLGRREFNAYHPSHKGARKAEVKQLEQDVKQQVGTAILEQDGTLRIKLDTLPVNGRLTIEGFARP